MDFALINQLAIVVFGIMSAGMVATKNKWWVVTGLLGQPFWFYTTISSEQWGMFTLSIFYTGTQLYGIKTWWLDPKKGIK
jgi:hypothetical protein